MRRRLFLFPALFLILAFSLSHADDKASPPLVSALQKILPTEPAEAVKTFALRPGFKIELVASEPLIRSPVAMDFDEYGRLFVVEFPEYNQYANPNGPVVQGCVKMLTDTDGDGRYDKVTVYADRLDSPVAVTCWNGGIYVGVVPDLWYFKDIDGDGKADLFRKVLTGFERDRAGEAMLNSFRWGIDNRFHIATGLAGGGLRKVESAESKTVAVRRQNILFDPRTGNFENTSGGGQHGMTLGDWGDTFVCDNSNPFQYFNYDTRYTMRNPFVQSPSPMIDVNAAGRYPNLHRISPAEPWREVRTRLRNQKLVPGSDEGGKPFGFFTGATGVTVYRGNAFPSEFQGNLFVGEVANNLVYRAKLQPKGLSWSAERAEQDREFLASRDVWFRPVQFANGPDGCLYVVDMYRELIEGAAFLPPELLKHVNVAGGIDRGRIWRITPDNYQRKEIRYPGKASQEELVAMLEHSNGWHRDTAARLLVQNNDRQMATPLRKLTQESLKPLARTHARYLLQSLQALTEEDVLLALADPEPRAREHALRMAESFGESAKIRDKMLAMTGDENPRVRLQLAFSLGAIPGAAVAKSLEKLVQTDSGESLMRLAVLCSAGDRSGVLFASLLKKDDLRKQANTREFILTLLGQMAAAAKADELAVAVRAINELPDSEKALSRDCIEAFVRRTPASQRSRVTALFSGKASDVLAELLKSARTVATAEKSTAVQRATAIRTLGLAPFTDTQSILQSSLGVRQPQPVQLAALEVLSRYDSPEVPSILLKEWSSMSPQIRLSATEALLSRPVWVGRFLDAVEKGSVRPADLDPARVQLLLKSTDAGVAQRASKLFGSTALSKRLDVINRFKPALDRKGDPIKGKVVFKDNCSVCHKLEGVGEAVGPDLASISNRGTESVLTNVLDPNREVLPQYYSYLLTTDDGLTVTGMISAETANTVSLRKVDGTTVTVQRINIESLKSTGLSAMPEGLEQKIDIPAMADLLAYLNSIR